MKLSLTRLILCLGVAASQVAAKKCPTTFVDGYAECGRSGWVQVPATLKVLHGVQSELSCAEACLAHERCKSFRFRDGDNICYLYKKNLEQMDFTDEVHKPGVSSERACYSNDCETIAACRQGNNCGFIYEKYYYAYYFFGCGYGVTAKFGKLPKMQMVLEGYSAQDACSAIDGCAEAYYRTYGPFNTYFDNVIKQWICDFYDVTYAPGHDQHVSPRTLTVFNESVGASFAYYVV